VHTTIVMCHLNDILCRHLRFKTRRDKTRTLTCSPGAPKGSVGLSMIFSENRFPLFGIML